MKNKQNIVLFCLKINKLKNYLYTENKNKFFKQKII